MDRAGYCKGIIERHKRLIDRVSMESPPLTMRGRLISQNETRSGAESTFSIISTSRSAKLAGLIENRVFIDDKNNTSGTVIEAYDDKLVVMIHRKLPQDIYNLRISANYNNEVLLKAGMKFAESEKTVHPALLHSAEYFRRNLRKSSSANGSHSENTQSQQNSAQESIDKEAPKTSQNEATLLPNVLDSDVDKIKFLNSSLNSSQKKAVFLSLQSKPFKILGPPGTGKTETIVEIICQNLSLKKTVLVCGPSNISVDNIIARFSTTLYYKENNTRFYRLGSSWKGLSHLNLESMASCSVSFLDDEMESLLNAKATGTRSASKELKQLREDKNKRKDDFIRTYKFETSLVFSTLFSSLKENFYFDLCIVDEACQATEMECFMGVVKAKSFILVGDPNQLCPDSPSLYERTLLPTVLLEEQYRMPGEIIRFSNEYFYKGGITSTKLDDFTFFNESKILFIDTAYFSYEESTEGTSRTNESEAMLTAKVAEWLIREQLREKEEECSKDGKGCILQQRSQLVGIIAPYSAQVLLIRSLVEAQPCCSVDTVDGFQGQERDFIILSLVRSNSEGDYGFLHNIKRMNVALTRCRRGLVIVGDSHNFKKNPFFSEFFRYLNRSAYVIDPDTFKELTGTEQWL